MSLARAKRLKPEEILERLGGLPERKFHCSVLGQEALREAVLDYERIHTPQNPLLRRDVRDPNSSAKGFASYGK